MGHFQKNIIDKGVVNVLDSIRLPIGIFIIIVSLVGNGLIISTGYAGRRSRSAEPSRSPRLRIYFVNLALSSMLVSLSFIPIYTIEFSFASVWKSLPASLCPILHTLQYMSLASSAFTIVSIAHFKYYGVRFPLKAYTQSTGLLQNSYQLVIIWGLSFVIGSPCILVSNVQIINSSEGSTLKICEKMYCNNSDVLLDVMSENLYREDGLCTLKDIQNLHPDVNAYLISLNLSHTELIYYLCASPVSSVDHTINFYECSENWRQLIYVFAPSYSVENNQTVVSAERSISLIYLIFIVCCLFIIPLILLAFFYARIVQIIYKRAKMQEIFNIAKSPTPQLTNRRKIGFFHPGGLRLSIPRYRGSLAWNFSVGTTDSVDTEKGTTASSPVVKRSKKWLSGKNSQLNVSSPPDVFQKLSGSNITKENSAKSIELSRGKEMNSFPQNSQFLSIPSETNCEGPSISRTRSSVSSPSTSCMHRELARLHKLDTITDVDTENVSSPNQSSHQVAQLCISDDSTLTDTQLDESEQLGINGVLLLSGDAVRKNDSRPASEGVSITSSCCDSNVERLSPSNVSSSFKNGAKSFGDCNNRPRSFSPVFSDNECSSLRVENSRASRMSRVSDVSSRTKNIDSASKIKGTTDDKIFKPWEYQLISNSVISTGLLTMDTITIVCTWPILTIVGHVIEYTVLPMSTSFNDFSIAILSSRNCFSTAVQHLLFIVSLLIFSWLPVYVVFFLHELRIFKNAILTETTLWLAFSNSFQIFIALIWLDDEFRTQIKNTCKTCVCCYCCCKRRRILITRRHLVTHELRPRGSRYTAPVLRSNRNSVINLRQL